MSMNVIQLNCKIVGGNMTNRQIAAIETKKAY